MFERFFVRFFHRCFDNKHWQSFDEPTRIKSERAHSQIKPNRRIVGYANLANAHRHTSQTHNDSRKIIIQLIGFPVAWLAIVPWARWVFIAHENRVYHKSLPNDHLTVPLFNIRTFALLAQATSVGKGALLHLRPQTSKHQMFSALHTHNHKGICSHLDMRQRASPHRMVIIRQIPPLVKVIKFTPICRTLRKKVDAWMGLSRLRMEWTSWSGHIGFVLLIVSSDKGSVSLRTTRHGT